MERYRVNAQERVGRIVQAVEASGGKILSPLNPKSAPFELEVITSDGDTLDLICYAFTANKYEQSGRPEDEHRFQVKYGSDFTRLHHIFVDPTRARTTLMFGVHDRLPLFIAVDPAMHEATWFSRSVEFKEDNLRRALDAGWYAWERDRVVGGRRRVMPQEDLRTESVIAFRPEHLLTFARFERIATGMDTGERLRFADNVGSRLDSPELTEILRWPVTFDESPEDVQGHPLLAQLELTAAELMDVIGSRFRLMAAVRGGVAEAHLFKRLSGLPGIQGLASLDKDGEPDFEFTYRQRIVRVECKNVLGRKAGHAPRVDFQKTRAAKGNPCSRYYLANQFEILAACLHPITGQWEYQFCLTSNLEPHRTCPGRLSERVLVSGQNWTSRIEHLLDALGS